MADTCRGVGERSRDWLLLHPLLSPLSPEQELPALCHLSAGFGRCGSALLPQEFLELRILRLVLRTGTAAFSLLLYARQPFLNTALHTLVRGAVVIASF